MADMLDQQMTDLNAQLNALSRRREVVALAIQLVDIARAHGGGAVHQLVWPTDLGQRMVLMLQIDMPALKPVGGANVAPQKTSAPVAAPAVDRVDPRHDPVCVSGAVDQPGGCDSPAVDQPVAPASDDPSQRPVVSSGDDGGPAAPPARKPAGAVIGERWTDDEDRRAIQMRRADANILDIAWTLNRTPKAVTVRFQRHLADWRTRDIADTAPEPAAPPYHGPWTPDLDARLRSYMADDTGIGTTAVLLKLPRDQVEARWKEWQAATGGKP